MLTRPASTFRHQARLAISLSWVAGYANVVVLIHSNTTISHVTGNATHVGQLLVEWKLAAAAFFAFLPACFLVGAMLSGICEHYSIRRTNRSIYTLSVALEAVMLALLSLVIVWEDTNRARNAPTDVLGLYLVAGLGSLAMGLQNATITRISGAVVRTTHLTGVFTDLGTETVNLFVRIAHHARRNETRRWRRVARVLSRWLAIRKLALLSSIAGSFVIGVFAGTWIYESFPTVALLPPALFLLTLLRGERVAVGQT